MVVQESLPRLQSPLPALRHSVVDCRLCDGKNIVVAKSYDVRSFREHLRARSQPTANKQDEDAVNAIYNRRRAPLLRESRHWPPGFRTDFFT
jgi:hypothetical protein